VGLAIQRVHAGLDRSGDVLERVGREMSNETVPAPEGSQSWEEAYESIAEDLRRSMPNYAESYRSLIEKLLRGLDQVTEEESLVRFVAESLGEIEWVRAVTPEFYGSEFHYRLKHAALAKIEAAFGARARLVEEIKRAAEATHAEFNERLRAAIAEGDESTQHDIFGEFEVWQVDLQAQMTAATQRMMYVPFAVDALKRIGSGLGLG